VGARTKVIIVQFPLLSDVAMATSPATVTIFAAPGRMSEVALYVNVRAPENLRTFNILMPGPKLVIVVVPVTVITVLKIVERSVVPAEAILCGTPKSAVCERSPITKKYQVAFVLLHCKKAI